MFAQQTLATNYRIWRFGFGGSLPNWKYFDQGRPQEDEQGSMSFRDDLGSEVVALVSSPCATSKAHVTENSFPAL